MKVNSKKKVSCFSCVRAFSKERAQLEAFGGGDFSISKQTIKDYSFAAFGLNQVCVCCR